MDRAATYELQFLPKEAGGYGERDSSFDSVSFLSDSKVKLKIFKI